MFLCNTSSTRRRDGKTGLGAGAESNGAGQECGRQPGNPSAPEIPTSSFLGVPVSYLTQQALVALIERAITRNARLVLGHHNLHSLYLAQTDTKMRRFYDCADHNYSDGMPLVLLARARGLPVDSQHRTTFLDVINPLMDLAARRGWRVFHLGCRPGVADRAAGLLRHRFPGLQIETAHGYFAASPTVRGDEEILPRIREYRPHIILVGMGMPRQEHWILDRLSELDANAVVAVGGLFDYIAGEIPMPPRWMGHIGLEWVYRLLSEPRRLWKRYLIEPWIVAWLLLMEWHKSACQRRREGW